MYNKICNVLIMYSPGGFHISKMVTFYHWFWYSDWQKTTTKKDFSIHVASTTKNPEHSVGALTANRDAVEERLQHLPSILLLHLPNHTRAVPSSLLLHLQWKTPWQEQLYYLTDGWLVTDFAIFYIFHSLLRKCWEWILNMPHSYLKEVLFNMIMKNSAIIININNS